jgi:Tfp pilus assembly protein PilO
MNKSLINIIFIILAMIFGIFFVLPKYQELDRLWQKIESKEEEIAERKEYFQDLRNTAEELKNYPEQLAKINSALPPDPDLDLPTLFDSFQKAASQFGLFLESISYSTGQSSSEFEGLEGTTVSLQLSGPYLSFKEFMSNYVEVNSRLMETESISFQSDPEEGPRDYSLQIKVYSYPE